MRSSKVRVGAAVIAVPLALGLAACSSGTSTPTGSPSASPTSTTSPSASASPTATATASPTTVSPTPTGTVKALSLGVSSTVAKPGERINTTISGPTSLAGKQVVIIDVDASDKYKIFSKLTLNSSGKANGYLILGMTDEIQALVPATSVSGGTWDPSTAILAQSGTIKITVK